MLSRLILLFVAVPLLELALLLQVGQWIGLVPTVALVVATGFAGAALARQQGLGAFLAVQQELATGRLPGRSLLDGLSIMGWEADVGAVEPGKYADLIAVRGNPLDDITLLERVAWVMKGGKVYRNDL